MRVKKVACGESHCLALVEDLSSKMTSLWSWGSNRCGQLGQGSIIKKSLPKPINYFLGFPNSEIVEVSFFNFYFRFHVELFIHCVFWLLITFLTRIKIETIIFLNFFQNGPH
jgi:hypothetical protein